jgi:hypothetical protein
VICAEKAKAANEATYERVNKKRAAKGFFKGDSNTPPEFYILKSRATPPSLMMTRFRSTTRSWYFVLSFIAERSTSYAVRT